MFHKKERGEYHGTQRIVAEICAKKCWMLEMDKLLRESSSQEMMGGTHTIGCTHFLTLYCC